MDPFRPRRHCPLSPAAFKERYQNHASSSWGKKRNQRPDIAAVENASLLVYGAYLEPKEIRHWSRNKIQGVINRVSLLSCCRGVDVSERTMVRELIRLLQTHAPELQWLLLTGPLLLHTNEHACNLLRSIPTRHLERLCLGLGHAASLELGVTLAQMFATCRNLKHVNLNCISWRNMHALQALAQGIPVSCCSLQLDLTSCRIIDQGFHLFVRTLLTMSKRQHDQGAIHDESSKGGSSRPRMEALILRGNHLTSESLSSLAQLISQGHVSHLNLNSMPSLFHQVDPEGHEGFKEFVQSIQNSTTLKELHLASCGIDRSCMASLLQGLVSSSRLECLNLNGNLDSRKDQLELLSSYLPHLPHLSSLRVCLTEDHNDHPTGESRQETSQRIQGFLEALNQNWRLTHLVLGKQDEQGAFSFHSNDSYASNDTLSSMDRMHHLVAGRIRKKSKQDKLSVRVQSVVQRNWLAQRLASREEEPPLAVWPQFLAKMRSRSAQQSSIVYQVLERHLISIATLPTKTNA